MGYIIREFQCGDCGNKFESADPVDEVVCPQCSSPEAERAFFTAPGIKSPKTASADRELKNLASDFGMTDLSNKDGAPVKRGPTGPAPQFTAPNMQILSKLGPHADQFSPVMPALSRGGPAPRWAARDSRNKPIT